MMVVPVLASEPNDLRDGSKRRMDVVVTGVIVDMESGAWLMGRRVGKDSRSQR
jgi:hypothetical protein